MTARTLMVQGTMSSVGKSLLVGALCRIFKQDGYRVAPFKAQNMALNSYATLDGREVGRAQAMQAEAAGVDVTVDMNPVLIKPEADSFAQIVVMGKPWARFTAGEYMSRRSELWSIVTHALDSLRAEYELVVMEGAGSPTELNLRRGDLVNMPMAEYADAPVLLVGDIDRGGVFAQLLGTYWLLDETERARLKGFIVNKFRGDERLFDDGKQILEEKSGLPVLGVVPFIRDLQIADEDSVALDSVINPTVSPVRRDDGGHHLDIVVIRLPHISNFDDFDPLRLEPDVTCRFVDRVDHLGAPDLIILPGTKATISDLELLRECGLADRVAAQARQGTAVLGICGGYQMLGQTICDPSGIESDRVQVRGLGLLPVTTTFSSEKQTVRAHGQIAAGSGLFANAKGLDVTGYEIHMGRTESVQPPQANGGPPAVEHGFERGLAVHTVLARGGEAADDLDGAATPDGWIAGTYFHGWFENNALRQTLLANLAARKGWARNAAATRFDRGAEYDSLAKVVRSHLDMHVIYHLLDLSR